MFNNQNTHLISCSFAPVSPLSWLDLNPFLPRPLSRLGINVLHHCCRLRLHRLDTMPSLSLNLSWLVPLRIAAHMDFEDLSIHVLGMTVRDGIPSWIRRHQAAWIIARMIMVRSWRSCRTSDLAHMLCWTSGCDVFANGALGCSSKLKGDWLVGAVNHVWA
jgi:hypothetical protein